MALASITDVQTRLGRTFEGSEVEQVEAWIADVESMILARIPNIEERIYSGALDSRVVSAVVSNAVIRKVKNPDGKQNERIDDYSYGLNQDAARGELFLTADEWLLLLPDGAARGAFTIQPYGAERVRGSWLTPTVWVPAP